MTQLTGVSVNSRVLGQVFKLDTFTVWESMREGREF